MKRAFYSRAILLIALLAAGAALMAQAADDTALRALTDRYFAAYVQEDTNGLMALWSAESPEFDSRQKRMQSIFAGHTDFTVRNAAVVGVRINGDSARVRVTGRLEAVDRKTRKAISTALDRTFTCVRENAAWKIRQEEPTANLVAAELTAAKTEAARATILAEYETVPAPDMLRALLTAGIRCQRAGDEAKALESYGLALRFDGKDSHPSDQAVLRNNLGILYKAQGEYILAREQMQEALRLHQKMQDAEGIAGAQMNLGNVCRLLGEYELARDYQQQAHAQFQALNNQKGMADTLNNLGIIYRLQGNYARALQCYQEALALQGETGDRKSVANLLGNIGIVYRRQGSYDLAREFQRKALALFETLGDRRGEARTLHSLGILFHNESRYAEALTHYQAASARFEALGDGAAIAGVRNSQGEIYRAQKKHELARQCFEEALARYRAAASKAAIASTLNNLGMLCDGQGDYPNALALADQAAALARETGSLEVLWHARIIAARAFRSLHRPAEARAALEEAIQIVEMLQEQIGGGEEEEQRSFENRTVPYVEMVALLIAQGRGGEAFHYAERARARTLRSVLQGGRGQITKALTAGEQEQEKRLRATLVSLNIQMTHARRSESNSPARVRQMTDRLHLARREWEAFQKSLSLRYPRLNAQRGALHTATLEEAREILPHPRAAILEFVVTQHHTYLFVITPGAYPAQPKAKASLQVFTLNASQEALAKQVSEFRKRVADPDYPYQKEARHLYDQLLKPAESSLRGKTLLCLLPDGPLWDLPFQALQSRANRFLIEDYALFTAPSLSALQEMGRQRSAPTAATTTLLAFGDPALGKATKERVQLTHRDANLAPLPEAAREVAALARYYGKKNSRIFIGANARESTFKAKAGHYRMLHFAVHGILDNRSPMYSSLLMSQVAEKDASEDGLLEAWEILGLDLQADLAILSACQTARGRIGAGEGVIGLAWAFFVAGCPSLLVSQWEVPSASTTQLMIEFHRHLNARTAASSLSRAEALRRAALKLLRGPDSQRKAPFFWAGFVVMGDGR